MLGTIAACGPAETFDAYQKWSWRVQMQDNVVRDEARAATGDDKVRLQTQDDALEQTDAYLMWMINMTSPYT